MAKQHDVRVTLKDIASRVNVSTMTVSRVLNKKDNTFITEVTRQRILQTANELGYRPNRFAQSLATGKTYRIAFLVPGINTRFFQEISGTLNLLLAKHDYEMMVEATSDITSNPRHALQLFHDVDGILMYSGSSLPLSEDFLRQHSKALPPIVEMAIMPQNIEHDTIYIDLYTPATKVLQVLLKTGRKRIAVMIPKGGSSLLEPRFRAYRDTMEKFGLELEIIETPLWLRSSNRQTIQEYFKEKGEPEAIFCGSDEIAIGVYRGLRDIGVNVGEDVILIGCDGIEDIEYMDHPISTIVQPVDEVCIKAWEFLTRRMKDRNIPRQTAQYEGKLVLRYPLSCQ